MGQVQNTPSNNQKSSTARRLPLRLCLRKDCGTRFQPACWNQRYCQASECLRLVRRWQAAKRQRLRRQSPEHRQQHAQSERERRKQKRQATPQNARPTNPHPINTDRGHAAKISYQDFCDRPGCYDPRRSSSRAAARYCSDDCRKALRRVLDRERKWLRRNTSAGRFKRQLEYQRRAGKTPARPGQQVSNTRASGSGGGAGADSLLGRRLFAIF